MLLTKKRFPFNIKMRANNRINLKQISSKQVRIDKIHVNNNITTPILHYALSPTSQPFQKKKKKKKKKRIPPHFSTPSLPQPSISIPTYTYSTAHLPRRDPDSRTYTRR